MKKLLATAALLALAMPFAASAQAVTPAITAALADPARPADQRARDAARHSGDILGRMKLVPLDIADLESLGQGSPHGTLAAAGDTHHHDRYCLRRAVIVLRAITTGFHDIHRVAGLRP